MSSDLDNDPDKLWKIQRSVLRKMKLHLLGNNDLIRILPDLIRLRVFTDEQLKEHDQFKGQSPGAVWHALEEQLDADRHAIPLFLVVLKKYNMELVKNINEQVNQELTFKDSLPVLNNGENQENDLSGSYKSISYSPFFKPTPVYHISNRRSNFRSALEHDYNKENRERYAPPSGRAYYSKGYTRNDYEKANAVQSYSQENLHNFQDEREENFESKKVNSICSEPTPDDSNESEKCETTSVQLVRIEPSPIPQNRSFQSFLSYCNTQNYGSNAIQRWNKSLDLSSIKSSFQNNFSDVVIVEERKKKSFDSFILSNGDVEKNVNELVKHCIVSARTAWIIRRCPDHSERFLLYLAALASLKQFDVCDLVKKCPLNKRFVKMFMETPDYQLNLM